MEFSKEKEHLMDEYILGRLDEENRKKIQEEITSDQKVKLLYDDRKVLIKGIDVFNRDELKKELAQIHNSLHRQPVIRKLFVWRKIAAAAAVVMVAFAGYYLLAPNPKALGARTDYQEIYAAHFEPFQFNVNTRGEGDQKLKTRAEFLYAEKNYREAIIKLEELAFLEPNNHIVTLALANAYLEVDRVREAVTILQPILKQEESMAFDQASWYTALAYVKGGRSEEAIPLLEKLANDENADHYNDAKKILGELK